MNAESVVAWLNRLMLARTGKGLSDLESTILSRVWEGKKYGEVATDYGCTEGHVKDVSSALWQFISQVLGEKVTKTNFRSAIARHSQVICPQPDSPQVGDPASWLQVNSLKTLPRSIQPQHAGVTTSEQDQFQPESSIPTASSFIGRSAAIADLNQLIEQGAKAIVIQGVGGLGKTTLAQQYLQMQGFDLVLELLMAKETQNLVSAERVVEEWLQQDLGVEPVTEFGVSLARLKRHLHGQRVGILLDNLEPALNGQGQFVAKHRNYVELLRVLTDGRVQSVTLITSRDRLCESSLNLTHYRLPGLDQETWQQFFNHWGIQIVAGQMSILQNLHHAYGGNAKAMGLLCGIIQADFGNDLKAYWQEHQHDFLATADLKDLISRQAARLQVLDPRAYRLFCRLGCFRYQAIPTLPTQALTSLLWDVPATEQRQVIISLSNRSLLEHDNGKYWLHPAIRAEAVLRLRGDQDFNQEWVIAHHQAANFWTERILSIQTTQDALQALEAYYHYIEIHDFEAAGRVLLKSRNNQWKQYLPLGSTLYRMGLIQPVIAAISGVVENIQIDHRLGELYNILGDVWWIAGEIHAAIACQEKTIALVTPALESLPETPDHKKTMYYYKMLAIDSRLSLGLYRVDLWELTEAAHLFQQVIQQSQNTEHHRWAEKASICLAWVNSYLGIPSAMEQLAATVITAQAESQAGHLAYFMQILGQTYINLGQFDQALPLLQKALAFAEAGYYKQIQARILTSLAEIHRYWGDYETAIDYHHDAIDLLERIGAKCDWAEALFQQGISYQALGDAGSSQASFTQALKLFQTMKAPRQVEKVALFRDG